jgi:hypothetical protein
MIITAGRPILVLLSENLGASIGAVAHSFFRCVMRVDWATVLWVTGAAPAKDKTLWVAQTICCGSRCWDHYGFGGRQSP